MKRNVQSSLYFSAYPLKTFIQEVLINSTSTHSPCLKSILSDKIRTMSRVRVFPMMNPYRQSIKPFVLKNSKLPKDIELTEKEWYNNYE